MKVKAFQDYLQKQKIGYTIILNTSMSKKDPNLFYFTQIDIDLGAIVIPVKGNPVLFIPGFEYERIKKQTRFEVKNPDSIFEGIKKKFGNRKKIGINSKYFTLAEKEAAKKRLRGRFIDISQKLADLRITKTAEEIEKIRKACKITTKIINELIAKLPKLKSEQAVHDFIEEKTKKAGCEFSFKPIIASGKNAYYPHHTPSNKLLKGFLVVDSGVIFKGYCSDMTRTVYLGKPNKKETEIYNKLLELQKKAIGMVKPGKDYNEIEEWVEEKLGKLKKYFIHSLGHSLGIEVHDVTSKKKYNKLILEPGMVVTVEPGIYIKNKFGMRIEDDVLVTKNGCEILTKTPKKLISIPVKV